jgi:hypothetical protein
MRACTDFGVGMHLCVEEYFYLGNLRKVERDESRECLSQSSGLFGRKEIDRSSTELRERVGERE